MKPKVFISRPIPAEVEAYIAEHCDYRKWPHQERMPREELLKEVKDVEGLLTTGFLIDAEFLEHAPHLKIVSNIAVGYNNFDLEALRKRNVLATNTPGVLDDTVADLIFGLMLAAARRIPELDQYMRAGHWKDESDDHLFGVDVHSTTLGIIGMGRIGETVAKRAKYGFNMDVLYYNRNRKEKTEQELGVTYKALDDLLQESDFVLLMTPLTPNTVKFIGADQFRQMKESAIFINASRGQTVDEQALIHALETGQIKGAGLDVYAQEPIERDNPLLNMKNVAIVPHIGSATYKTRFDMAMLAAQNLVAGLQGEEPPNLLRA